MLYDKLCEIVFIKTSYMDDIDAVGIWADIQFNGFSMGFHIGDPFAIKVEYLHLINKRQIDCCHVAGWIGIHGYFPFHIVHVNGDGIHGATSIA